MLHARAIADTTQTRADLRLVVLAQWVRAGLDLIRGAATSGRSLVSVAVALWQVAQAVRLALVLAQRLAEARRATGSDERTPATTAGPASPLGDLSTNAAALRRALAQLAAAISDALGVAPRRRASDWGREPSGSRFRRARLKTRGPSQRLLGRPTSPRRRRPDRPPGPERPRWRSACPPHAWNMTPTPIAALAIGRAPLA